MKDFLFKSSIPGILFILLLGWAIYLNITQVRYKKQYKDIKEHHEQLLLETQLLQTEFAQRSQQIRDTLLLSQHIIDSLQGEYIQLERDYARSLQTYSTVGYRPDNSSDYYKSSWTRIITTRPDTNAQQ